METISYEVFNKATGKVVGTCKSKAAARRSRDMNDMKYGSYIHSIREIVK